MFHNTSNYAANRGRGRDRGHGRFSGRGGYGVVQKDPIPALPEPKAGQKSILTITSSTLTSNPNPAAIGINSCEYVASYSWQQSGKTIFFPGLPPKWTPPSSSMKLSWDTGEYLRDQNAGRHPSFPYEPGVRSIFALDPNFDGQEVDVVACGSTLGSLLHFVNGTERTFRFGVERIGRTLFLIRAEHHPTVLIQDIVGYGHSFPEAYTMWDACVKESASHQRLVEYKFGSLTCVVRIEVDGYLPAKLPIAKERASKNATLQKPIERTSSLQDNSLFAGLNIAPKLTQDSEAVLKLVNAGNIVPQGATFDLKTRSTTSCKPIDMDEQLRRMWVSRVPNFILAHHVKGVFCDEKIQISDVSSQVDDWETRNQAALHRLHTILKKLMEIAGEQPNKKLEVRRSGKEDLQIWSQVDGWSALPDSLKKKWLGNLVEIGMEH